MPAFSDDTMFRYSAATYLRAWIVIDSHFVNAFNNALTHFDVGALLREYKAVRNFKKAHEEDGDERFEHFVQVLTGVKQKHAGANTIDAINVVNQINSEIAPHYKSDKHKNFVSAASKAAWMLFQHPVAIYDSLACDGLHSLKYAFSYGDYSSYYAAWTKYRADKDANIEAASAWVAKSDYAKRLAGHGVATLLDIEGWASSGWFKNRICDQRLVWLGSNDDLAPADLAAILSPTELA